MHEKPHESARKAACSAVWLCCTHKYLWFNHPNWFWTSCCIRFHLRVYKPSSISAFLSSFARSSGFKKRRISLLVSKNLPCQACIWAYASHCVSPRSQVLGEFSFTLSETNNRWATCKVPPSSKRNLNWLTFQKLAPFQGARFVGLREGKSLPCTFEFHSVTPCESALMLQKCLGFLRRRDAELGLQPNRLKSW